MTKITKNIAIISGKGGVGKTTTSINLGLSLQKLEKRSIVIDTNLETPNIALQLGFPPKPMNIHNILRGSVKIRDAISVHKSGLNVIQAGLSLEDSVDRSIANFRDVFAPLQEDYDYIIMDCSGGLWGTVRRAIKAADEVLVVTNPELPALVDALKVIKVAESLKKDIRGIVVNKVRGMKHELKDDTIRGILRNYPIISKIPFDINVRRSLAKREPVTMYKKYAPSSRAFKKLAAHITDDVYTESILWKVLDYFQYGFTGTNGYK